MMFIVQLFVHIRWEMYDRCSCMMYIEVRIKVVLEICVSKNGGMDSNKICHYY